MNKLPEKELLRVDEVADYFRVTIRTVYKWIDAGTLEAIRVRRHYRVKRLEVEKLTITAE